jgi:3-oxoacyl-[acyl-carrier protein] reductase
MPKELSTKVALVTGSGRGLGRAIAEALAVRGADIAVHDLDRTAPRRFGEASDLDAVAKDLSRHGTRVAAVTGNISDEAAVSKMRGEIEARLGPVDILVNCAGGDIGASGNKPQPNTALDIPLADVKALIENNLIGTVMVCRTFIPPMRERGGGAVINVASAAAHLGVSDGAIYAILKAAVAHYTRCLARELMPTGVRVNAVSPGPTKTARFEATRTVDPRKMDSSGKSLDRYAEPSEIADAVAFLAGEQGRFVNGQVLRVDGGLTLFAG